MATTGLFYDNSSYKLRVRRATDPLKYQLYPGQVEHCNDCVSFFGTRNSREDVSIARNKCETGFGSLTEIESELKNMILPADESNERGCNRGYLKYKKNLVHKKNCSPFLESLDTRFSHPPITYRDVDETEYKFNPYLHFPPSAYVVPDGVRWGVDTRIVAKDTFVIPRQKYWDTGKSLPNAHPNKNVKCGICCSKGNQGVECGFCDAAGKK
jgi:hypothetical protein